MLSQRSKIIILIGGAVIVFGIIISTVFNLWPSKKPIETAPVPVDLSFLEKDEAMPAGQTFDASNKDALAALTGSAGEDKLTAPEKDARDAAEFFVARFGTFSSDALWANIDDLQSFMTPSMRSWTEKFKATAPARTGYYAATAEAAAAAELSYSAALGRAQFSIITNRTETVASKTANYQQTATVELRQDSTGAWKVNSLFWGDKQ